MNNNQFKKVTFKQYIGLTGLDDVTLSDEMYDKKYKEYINIQRPKRATKGSAGYDFFSPIDFTLNAGDSIKINTGIRVKIDSPQTFLAIFPRSSLGFKYRLQLDNTIGIIDGDYYYSDNEGCIFIKITNDNKSGKTLIIKANEAIAQGIFLQFGLTCDDNTTEVRNGGLGSTGK